MFTQRLIEEHRLRIKMDPNVGYKKEYFPGTDETTTSVSEIVSLDRLRECASSERSWLP